MNSTDFRMRHESSWRHLESLLQGNKKHFASGRDLTDFAVLYRKVSSDLAYAKTYFPEDNITRYLNALVTVAHQRLYRAPRGGASAILRFLGVGFPQLVRRTRPYFAASCALSILAALFGYVSVMVNPMSAYSLLPGSFIANFDPATAGPHSVDSPLMSSIIMTHNIQVALMAFLGGITLGAFTLYALWQNGLILGVLAAMFQTSHRAFVFWSLIVPHGVTELCAIFIAGAAGLLFGHRMLVPGRYKRGAAIRTALKEAVLLMLGTVPMLVVAGCIEGFLTPSSVSAGFKYVFALATLLWWCLYFGKIGKRAYRTNRRLLRK